MLSQTKIKTISLSTLIYILEEELFHYEKMLENLKIKQESIVKGDVSLLRAHVILENKQISESKKIVDLRNRFLKDYYDMNNMNSSIINLSKIIELCKNEYLLPLTNLKFQLKKTLNEIGKINNENKILLNFCIEHVKGMAHLFLNERQDQTDIYSTIGILYHKSIQRTVVDRHI